jgi:general secretion pathway protein K
MTTRQTGAALLTAMLTVALVASMASAALWQQWRSVEVETAERTRTQSLWVLSGALDWARLILREDARSGGADHLGEPWAVPLEEARLSTFLAADKNNTVDGAEASAQIFLSGRITDLQGRMNVLNLVENGKVSAPWLKAFTRLFEQLGLTASELSTVAENLRFAQDHAVQTSSSLLAPLVPQRVSQLRWLGLSENSLAKLGGYITVLPVRTPVNLNTASVTVLYACIPTLDLAQAQRLASSRQTGHFRTLNDVGKVVAEVADEVRDAQHSVSSRFFEVQGRLRLDQTVVEEQSVVQREGLIVTTLWRDRGGGGTPAVKLAPLQ